MAFSYFFRDIHTLNMAVDYLISETVGRSSVRIWDAGCAMGQEPYTLAVLLAEKMSRFTFNNVKIHATDIDKFYGEVVVEGVYDYEQIKRIPADIRSKYFVETENQNYYKVEPHVKSKVEFTKHDLLSLKTIGEGYSLILCKNVLLHFSPEQRVSVLKMFHNSLAPGGILVMEQTQDMPKEAENLFAEKSDNSKIYAKRETVAIEGTGIGSISLREDLNNSPGSYNWYNIEDSGKRVGKIRASLKGEELTIHSISIFPEYRHNGFAKTAVNLLKGAFNKIEADRVRAEAIGFWQKMCFTKGNLGNYYWQS